MQTKINNSIIELIQGDITEQGTDAIVNAANEQLLLGSGVAGAIRMKGGIKIQQACDKLAPIATGQAVITTAGNLKAKKIIHAVGPIQGQAIEDEKLAQATLNSLKLAEENNIKSISFPAISTGVFGFPMASCARIMLSVAVEYLKAGTNIERVVFCLFDNNARDIFVQTLKILLKS
jgi:O-acetyl-ADP-ribose deacetylase (regulator of RNase III)